MWRRGTSPARRMAGLRPPEERVGERRARRLEQQAQRRPMVAAWHREAIENPPPLDRLGEATGAARAVRVVDLKHERLLEHTRGAQARGMLGVALDLGRPALVTFNQQPGRVAIEHRRRRVYVRDARRDVGWLPDVRHDLLGHLARAARPAGESDAGAEQLREPAAGQSSSRHRRGGRKSARAPRGRRGSSRNSAKLRQ